MAEEMKIDFIDEFHSRNMHHITYQICSYDVTHRDIVNLLRVCKRWNNILKGDEECNKGSIWRQIIFTKYNYSIIHRHLYTLNGWWPDMVMPMFSNAFNEDTSSVQFVENENYVFRDFCAGNKSLKHYELQEAKRRLAVFISTDLKIDLSLNIRKDKIKDLQSRLLFVGGIVCTLSFCGQGGRYIFCGMLNGDIKMWELWNVGVDGKRKLEFLGRAWKVFKGHEERINAFDFLELNDSGSNQKDIVFGSASDDHSFRVWSFQTGSQLRVVRSGTGTRVFSILLLEDYIVTATSTSSKRLCSNINLFKGKTYSYITNQNF